MTVREAVKVLKYARTISICYNGDSVATFNPGNAFMVDVLGDFVVSEINTGIEEDLFELSLAVKAYKATEV